MIALLALLGAADNRGFSVSKGTLEVIALILLILVLALMLFGRLRNR